MLEHVTREVNIEALPTDIPEAIQVDVSALQINDTLLLASVTAPEGVTITDDPEETVVATLTPPRSSSAEEEALEEETERVGEGAGEGEGGPPTPSRRRAGRRRRQLQRVAARGTAGRLFGAAPVDWLVVGLGNPGERYARTPTTSASWWPRSSRGAGTCRGRSPSTRAASRRAGRARAARASGCSGRRPS